MTLSAAEFEFQPPPRAAAHAGPAVESTHWGWAITERRDGALPALLAAVGERFTGVILLMAGAGLWLMPDSLQGEDIFAMKLAAMVMFFVFGGYLLWAGQRGDAVELQVDTRRGEVRLGRRGAKGVFRLKTTLGFGQIGSVYLMRSKDHAQPARLFLRVAASDEALEVVVGPEAALERLRERLARDLAGDPRQPVEIQLAHHGVVAA